MNGRADLPSTPPAAEPGMAAPGAPAQPAARSDVARLLLLRRQHWQRTRLITGLLLALWFSTCFLTVFYARELTSYSVFGWPLSFYLAAQGASLVYLAIIGAYALLMRRLDRRIRARIKGEAP
jgi:putative solute:sodium symporter small subunit